MPVYSLGEKKPQLPEEGLYWVAPDAHIIGNVVLGKMLEFGLDLFYEEIMI